MKIAISAAGPTLESVVDPRFGRAACFILYDLATRRFEAHDNKQNLSAVQGAGIQAAETVARLDAKALITGHCGPKAFRALVAAEIAVYSGVEGRTVAEAIALYEDGKLESLASADAEGHW